MIKAIVTGVAGRMGGRIVHMMEAAAGLQLVGAVETPGHAALGKDVGYDSDFLNVGNVTSVILPDDLPCFHDIRGRIEIGVTAVSSGGNESDMSVVSVFCDFSKPEEPTNLTLEEI